MPGSALMPAVYAQRRRIAFESGRQICRLAEQGVSARKILTEHAVRNAVRVCSAICGSTNAPIHLAAIAREAGLSINIMDEFAMAYRVTPQIVKVNPDTKWVTEDFYRAGGVPRVMKNLGALLNTNVMTCTCRTLRDNLGEFQFLYLDEHHIIRTLEHPYSPRGGLAVLRGNLSPNGAITKPGAFDESLSHFVGKARCITVKRPQTPPF